MLHENLKKLRKARGLSQEDLAEQLHVVRQTVSKWEQGLSVPDAELLIRLAEALGTTVGALLGEPEEPAPLTELQEIAIKLELLNDRFARQQERKRKGWRCLFIAVIILTAVSLLLSLLQPHILQLHSFPLRGDLGIIGGADGPTSIIVASAKPTAADFLVHLLVIAAAVYGLSRTKKP